MTTIGLNSEKGAWMEANPGRAVCPQTAVHLEWAARYSESKLDRKAEVNGALGTERPTHKPSIFCNSRKGKTEINRYCS